MRVIPFRLCFISEANSQPFSLSSLDLFLFFSWLIDQQTLYSDCNIMPPPSDPVFFTASLPLCSGLDMEERTREMKLKMNKYKQGAGSDSRLEQDYHKVRRGRGIHSDTCYMRFGRFRGQSTCANGEPSAHHMAPALHPAKRARKRISTAFTLMCAQRTQQETDTAKTRSLAIKGGNACGSMRVVIVKWLKTRAKHSRACILSAQRSHTHCSALTLG